ncbi:MAG TPA: triose-phosphate isomerase [Ktedonobacteraceae bacterium]|jgi:triosephosphate isomerase
MAQQRTAIIAGNWKMNYGSKQAASFTQEIAPRLAALLSQTTSLISILCPPAISLPIVRTILDQTGSTKIELGAQNMYYEEQGAFTGEISPTMIREICSDVILGHSERRTYFAESDELINKKTLAAFKYGLRPIVCIGENLDQYEHGQTQEIIRTQMQLSLANLNAQQATELVVAYEPIWAIGTGKAATAEIAGDVIHFIRTRYQKMYGPEAAAALRILYGGSVTSANISEFMVHPDIDGALVGGASIKPDFLEIVSKSLSVIQ